ncbi:MAG: flavodoxin family protein [Thermodesulfobacteriota bacterium]
MTEVLGLYFSPRQGGNSDLLLDEFLRGAKEEGAEVRTLYTRRLKIAGCIECGECDETGECILRDDMDEVYPLLIQARRLVTASPIFFYGLPAQGKALIDRSQALWNRLRLDPGLRRPDGRGFFLGVGATRGQNLFDGALLTVKYFLDAVGLPKGFDSLTFRRVEAKAAIKDHPTALSEAHAAGRALVR